MWFCKLRTLTKFVLLTLELQALTGYPLGVSAINARHSSKGYETISLQRNGSVTRATISNPPINLFDYKLAADMYNFLQSLASGQLSDPPKVVIFDSADPEFFIGHLDVSNLLLPTATEKTDAFNKYVACTALLRNITSVIFIGEVNGQGFGGGNELLVQMDMRYAGPKTRVGAMEIAMGLTHAVGGLQFMNRLVNRGRAFEYVLSGNNIDGPTAEAIGWANHYYDSAWELRNAVDEIAHRIALFPVSGINATKFGLNANNPTVAVLEHDLEASLAISRSATSQKLVTKVLELSKNETRSPFELGLDDTLEELF